MLFHPKMYAQAIACDDSAHWIKTLEEELAGLEAGCFVVEELPDGAGSIPSKWIFTVKTDSLGKLVRFKALIDQKLIKTGWEDPYGPIFDADFKRAALARREEILAREESNFSKLINLARDESKHVNGPPGNNLDDTLTYPQRIRNNVITEKGPEMK